MRIVDYKPDVSFCCRTVDSFVDDSQKQSYKYIVERVSNGLYVDVGDNSYLDVYLSELNIQLRRSLIVKDVALIRKITKILDFIINHYQNTHNSTVQECYPSCIFALDALGENIKDTIKEWLNFLSRNECYANYNDVIVALYATFCDISVNTYVDAKYFSVFAAADISKYLTNFGNDHVDDIKAIMSDLLNRDYQISNENYINKMYKFEEGEISVVDHDGVVGSDHVFDLCMNTEARKTEYDEGIYNIKVKVPVYTPRIRDLYVKNITRESELILRHETGVGHRWVSESILFKQIQLAFKDCVVERHASPNFLRRQHYDVYLPELKIALEYQGDQHFRPIPLFGGEAGFIETQKRDKRKRRLSEDNGVYQIDVLPGYDIVKVFKKILQCNKMHGYDLDILVRNVQAFTKTTDDNLELRKSAVTRVNLEHKVNIEDDNNLEIIIARLVRKASKTKIGQRKLTTESILRYQGLCSKYMKTGEHEKELKVRIMMYARGVESCSFDKYWREKELIKIIGIKNFTID